jgi:signal peptidase II
VTGSPQAVSVARLRTRRLVTILAAVGVAALDLGAKAWAEARLPPGGVETGPVDLLLGYNSGVAFSLGANAPTAVVIASPAAVTTGIAVAAWRVSRWGTRSLRAALALVLGGAVANLLDRSADGSVTDYLHTGWWPTFNLADVAIVVGGALLAVSMWSPKEVTRQPLGRSEPAEESG